MAAKGDRRSPMRWVVGGVVLIAAAWVFPPFHIVRLAPATAPATGLSPATGPTAAPAAPAGFDPQAAAAKVWRDEMPAAARQAADVNAVVALLQKSPREAKAKYGHSADLGSATFFVRGHGRVVSRDRNQVTLALEGLPGAIVALRIGPVFGNTVRDGCGLLNLNSFPGLADYNAISAALNALVARDVLPGLRQGAQVGTTVTFAGCAEAPDFAADPGEPVLTIVPVEAEVK